MRRAAALRGAGARRTGVGVLNLMGRVHMANLDDPFRAAEREVAALTERTRIIFVDFHAEVTSEKIAMGWYLDGGGGGFRHAHARADGGRAHLARRYRLSDRCRDDRTS